MPYIDQQGNYIPDPVPPSAQDYPATGEQNLPLNPALPGQEGSGNLALEPSLAQPAPVLDQPLPNQAPLPGQAPVTPQVAPAKPTQGQSRQGPGMVEVFDHDIALQQAKEQEAAQNLSQAQREGAGNVGSAQDAEATKRAALAQEQDDKIAANAKHNQELDQIDAANLDKAKTATIPDFWEGRQGARVGAAIAAGIAGIGAGLLGSTRNVALETIQHNIDQYFIQQKERVDNLYKYADATGRMNARTRSNYAQELLDLKDQHSAVVESAAAHVKAVADMAKGSADAANTDFLASKLGETAIKDRQDVRELRSKIKLQDAQASEAKGKAAESNARAKQGGYLTPAQQNTQAIQVVGELDKAYKYVTDPKVGIAAKQREIGGILDRVKKDPNNPTNWVALVDNAIKTNTGKAAIMSQYNLYMGHAAGASDTPEQVLEHFRTNKPSPAQQAAILSGAQQAQGELAQQGKEANDNYHAAVDSSPIIQNNPAAKAAVAMHERNTFGTLQGYGKQSPAPIPGQNSPGSAPVEGSTSTSKGVPIVYRGGKWVAQ